MVFTAPNYLGVFVAALASFLLGWLWYGVLFRTQWMAAVGKSEEQCKDMKPEPVHMAMTFVCLAIMALMLAGIIGHLGPSGYSVKNGIISGAAVWFGFVITTMYVAHGYQGAKRALTWIDGGHWLAVLAVQGAVLGLMGAG